MVHRPKLLVLAHDQFGYSITKFKHCEYARDYFDITYVGWDYGLPKIELTNVKVVEVSRASNIFVRNFRLLKTFHKEIRNGYDVVFFNYVRFISLVKLANLKSKAILYIDTLGVEEKKSKRFIRDFLLTIESYFFKHVAVINSGIAKKINIKKFDILQLGGECFSSKSNTFEELSLLYVGTLTNRNIMHTVKGFHKFIESNKRCQPSYVIIGDGANSELDDIKEYIHLHNLEKFITTTGFVPSNKLMPFFETANIGVSYVPITSYYQFQPPTKTFEYLISGLPVIATATQANKEIVNPEVSEVIDDNAEAFFKALIKMQERRISFDSNQIRGQFSKFTWENVVKNSFVPLIEKRLKS